MNFYNKVVIDFVIYEVNGLKDLQGIKVYFKNEKKVQYYMDMIKYLQYQI